MADEERSYPDLPVDQWWKLRTLFKGNLPKVVNFEYIMDVLKISESTARNTVRNLNILGLLDKGGKPTDRANDWRGDDLYPQICKEITEQIYPQELLDIAQASSDRAGLVSWFTRKTKIGETAAHKNAAIFEVIYKAELKSSKESMKRIVQLGSKSISKPRKVVPPISEPASISTGKGISVGGVTIQPKKPLLPSDLVSPSIHIDIQLHISPDAPTSQIEEIFAAIAKHLYRERKAGE